MRSAPVFTLGWLTLVGNYYPSGVPLPVRLSPAARASGRYCPARRRPGSPLAKKKGLQVADPKAHTHTPD